MKRTYSDKDLEAMKGENHRFTYDGKEYDGYTASQEQRRIERTIRKLKREQAKYKEFSKAAGLPEQRERMRVLY